MGKVAVDKEKCIGCGICEGACPNDAISVTSFAEIDEERCVGCENCCDECPMEAIYPRE